MLVSVNGLHHIFSVIAFLIFLAATLLSAGYVTLTRTPDWEWSSKTQHIGTWLLLVGIPWGCLIKFLVR